MLENQEYSVLVKQYAEILKTKKALGPYSNPRNEMGNLIKYETQFLDIINPSMRIRVCYIANDLKNIVKCPICSNNGKIEIDGEFNYVVKGCSRKCSDIIYKTIKDPVTGLTNYQARNLKGANTKRNIIDGDGNNIFDIAAKKASNTYKIEDENGKTLVDRNREKHFKTIHKMQDSGKTRAQEIARKSADTMTSKIDPDTGLTISKSIGLKVSKSQKTIMSDGRRKSQHSKDKQHITMSIIDDETGLSKYDKSSSKRHITMSIIDDETGLSKYDMMGTLISKSSKSSNFKKIVNKFPNDYTLISTLNEYLNNNLLKYSHKCGSTRESYWPYIRCTKCYPYNKSLGENEVLKFCESLNIALLSNSRSIIKPLELDVYIPDYNLAIEYDGVFWHSSYSVDSENKDYHLLKTQECEQKGIQLFHIFENEWLDPTKQNIWKSIIRNRLSQSERIFARKTEVRSVTSKDKIEFLNSNHLQGSCNSSVNLGLYLDDELVSLMTFGRSRYDKKVDWELIRFCNKLNTSVIGGASKLLKRFRLNNEGSIISYADKRRSNGNLYKQLGFEFSQDSAPNYWYYKDPMVLESRIQYQKHKLKDKLEIFDPDMTESENMYKNGYRKIYDCGNQVWILY